MIQSTKWDPESDGFEQGPAPSPIFQAPKPDSPAGLRSSAFYIVIDRTPHPPAHFHYHIEPFHLEKLKAAIDNAGEMGYQVQVFQVESLNLRPFAWSLESLLEALENAGVFS